MTDCYMRRKMLSFFMSKIVSSKLLLLLYSARCICYFLNQHFIDTIKVIGPSMFFPTGYFVPACKIVGCHQLLLHPSSSSHICHQLWLYSSREVKWLSVGATGPDDIHSGLFIYYFLHQLFIHVIEVFGPSMFLLTGYLVPSCKIVGCSFFKFISHFHWYMS